MDVEDLRLAVCRTFARDGRPPAAAELAVEFDCSREQAWDGLRELAAAGIWCSARTAAS